MNPGAEDGRSASAAEFEKLKRRGQHAIEAGRLDEAAHLFDLEIGRAHV